MLVGARCYDAQAGRFVTRDTLLGEHPYLYCEHEPVGSVDPSGHEDNPIAAVTLGGITVVPEPGRPGDHWAPPGFSLLVPWLPALPVVGFPPREPPILIIHLPPMVIPRPPRLPRPGFPPPRLIVEPILFVGGDRDGGAGGKVTITF
ncbi:MAG: hypothetical protein IT208_11375 [Chthonomonadales bacterium]|nr:hypothetical protein [Chthonomonadales bacterium]